MAWRWSWFEAVGEGQAGGRLPALLSHVSFDVIQAESHALICAAPLSLLLAFPTSTQPVLNDLGEVQGRVGGPESPIRGGPTQPCPLTPYLVGIVKEFQHCEDAGPDEQSHLAPDVTCGVRSERLVDSGPRGYGAQ